MNAHHEQISFDLPDTGSEAGWVAVVDTSCQTIRPSQMFNTQTGIPIHCRPDLLVVLVERRSGQLRGKERRHEP